MPRKQDADAIRAPLPDLREKRRPLHLGHLLVADDHGQDAAAGMDLTDRFDRLLGIGEESEVVERCI